MSIVKKMAPAIVFLIVVLVAVTGIGYVHKPSQGTVEVNPAAATTNSTTGGQLFVPIDPCRIIDTRKTSSGIANTVARSFRTKGAGSYASQGGLANCPIPDAATSIATNVTITQPDNDGYVKAYQFGDVEPNSNFITYWQDKTVTSNPIFTIADGKTNLTFRNYGGNIQLIVDVTGYFEPAIQAYILSGGTIQSSTSRVQSVTHDVDSGYYTIQVDADVYNCAVAVTSGEVNGTAESYSQENNLVVVRTRIWDQDSNTFKLADEGFNLTVTC